MKVLFFDIENLMKPEHIFNSGKPGRFSAKPAGFCADLAYILVFGYKWLGDDKAQYIIPSKKDFKQDPTTDITILPQVFDVLNSADVVVTWYGAHHDFPFTTSRLAQQGMYLDQKIKHVDLHAVAKKVLALSSNRLGKVSRFFGQEDKTNISPAVWARTWGGDYDALTEMAEYCVQDVEVLEQVYTKLLPLHSRMPITKAAQAEKTCNTCGGTRLQARGRRVTLKKMYQRYQCQECGSWTSGELL